MSNKYYVKTVVYEVLKRVRISTILKNRNEYRGLLFTESNYDVPEYIIINWDYLENLNPYRCVSILSEYHESSGLVDNY